MKIYPLGPVSPRFFSITSATNATPIVITTSAPHGFSSTDVITISGITGNTNANGTYVNGASTQFTLTANTITLVGKTGNGAAGGTGIASAPQQLITAPNFPVIVADNTKLLVKRLLFTTVPAGTASLYCGTAGLNQATFANVFRAINPPPAQGLYDYYEVEAENNAIPIVEYWVDAAKPGTEAVLTTFWIQ